MAKCKDCLHYEACLTFSKFINAARDVEQGCEHFKDRIKYVEVVRCKDCKHRGKLYCSHLCLHPMAILGKVTDADFCSYGERESYD